MLSEKLIADVCKFVESQVYSAELVIDNEVKPMEILRTESEGDMLKIFTNASDGKGRITDIYIRDKEGNIIISKPDSVLKFTGYSLVASFYIRIKEVEISDPINIFDLAKEMKHESI